ncbi:hypothetical protein J4E90_001174 [Alternaria incomplexa]|uniref:uncharacterized protein n=1 Tax=Alternaria incomplexa TaxID=1187928 RepID=UPI00221EAE7B|nr:uncharacterized protein J4E90_001174 [Alternaria incomplexa]KAI4922740.1 hypothetical protein J4E90_001174 [Alternaria incomplexa]
MQLITLLSAASAMVATTSATSLRSAIALTKDCDTSKPYARVINRCDYDVHLWSVYKGDGCPEDGMVTLKTGETYSENYPDPEHGDGKTGVSIKISKTKQCKGVDITQLEYFRKMDGPVDFRYNYLDVSYVDCLDGDCPARNDGYYLKAGTQSDVNIASAANTFCPILACHDKASCDKVSYVLPDDVQTKSCYNDQNMDFYMCGGEAPSGDYGSSPSESESSAESSAEPSTSSTKLAEYSAVKPTSTSASYEDSYTADIEVAAAAVTPAPEKQDDKPYHKLTKTVYVTAVEYVNAKRHAHDHARRHQPFHA